MLGGRAAVTLGDVVAGRDKTEYVAGVDVVGLTFGVVALAKAWDRITLSPPPKSTVPQHAAATRRRRGIVMRVLWLTCDAPLAQLTLKKDPLRLPCGAVGPASGSSRISALDSADIAHFLRDMVMHCRRDQRGLVAAAL